MADANVLIAAFLRDSTVRRIVTLSALTLLVPGYAFEEFRRHLPDLQERSGLGKREAQKLIDRLTAYFGVVPAEIVSRGLPDARRIMAGIDPSDAAYLAVALAVPCDGIWSDDPHLRRQTAVRCWTTPEIVAELKASGLRI